MHSKHEGIVLSILVLGTLMGALDTTIVLLALPSITEGLNSNLGETIWVILIYLLVISITTMQFGRLGDLFGRSKMFNLGFAVFTIGSAFCGFAPTNGFLVGFRTIQAIGGALMQATTGAIIADTFGVGMRGRAYGYTAMGWNIGGMLGIVLGGMLTTFIGWRFIFFILLSKPWVFVGNILDYHVSSRYQGFGSVYSIIAVNTRLYYQQLSLAIHGQAFRQVRCQRNRNNWYSAHVFFDTDVYDPDNLK